MYTRAKILLVVSLFSWTVIPASSFADDVTLTGTVAFSALDGSAEDHDGLVNGVFTVNDGDLVVQGTVQCNDDPPLPGNAGACPIAINVSGDLIVEAGGGIFAENRMGGGAGGHISLTVGGDLILQGPSGALAGAVVSSSRLTGKDPAGNITLVVLQGNVDLEAGSTVAASTPNGPSGAIEITAGGTVSLAGLVASGPSRQVLGTKLTGKILNGGESKQTGGAILIQATGVLVEGSGIIVSQGESPGSQLVQLDACGLEIRGLVASVSKQNGPSQVVLRSGQDLLIDGRDLGSPEPNPGRLGRVRADGTEGGSAGYMVDLFANGNIEVLGPPSSTLFTVSSSPGSQIQRSGGAITAISLAGALTASGNAFEAGKANTGNQGGTIDLKAQGNATLDGATLRAVGDHLTNSSSRKGGSISVRSYQGSVSWTFGVGDVRPTGSGVLPPSRRGTITLTACSGIDTTGTQFPTVGDAVLPFPVENDVCSPSAPSLPSGELPLPQCETAPTVVSTSPADGAVNQATNIDLSVTFSEPVNVTASAFTLECPVGSPVSFTLSPAAPGGVDTFTLDPTADLPSGVTCTVTVVAAEVTDTDANDPPDQMAEDYVFTFTTDAAPAVTTTTPSDGAMNVAGEADITINFSEPVNVTASAFTLECPVGTPVAFTLSPAAPGGVASFTLDPNTNLPAGVTCRVTVVAAEVTDTDANDPPDQMAANFEFDFTTDVAPVVTTTIPADGATSVAANTNITVNFSEPVNVTASTFTLECPVGTPVAFTLSPAAPGGVDSFTLDPAVDLPSGATCRVTVVASQVTDVDESDPPDQMAVDHVFTFTIDEAPSVTGTTPANGATGIAPSTTITINFSESVNATTSSFAIECPVGSAQAFSLSSSPSTTFTLTPTSNLPAGTVCRVTVFAAQVTDEDLGDPPNNMALDHVFTFSVPPVALNDTYAPNIIGNVGVNTASSTNFSILTNDTPNVGMTITTSGVSAQGGTVSVTPSGTFTYIPPAGYEGADSFTYTISNDAGTSAPATVSLNVAGMIWFINNNAVPGDGRLSSPLNSLAGFQAINNGAGNNPAAGDNVFLYQSSTAYTGPVTLLGNQKLIGQDATATLAAIAGVTVPLDSFPLPAMNSLDVITSTISISSAGINAVNLNNVSAGNTVRGLTITTGNASSIGVNGSSFGAFSTGDISVTGNGPALNLTTGSVSGTINSVSSSGSSTQGINLSGLTGGSLTIGTTSVTNSTGVGINVQSSAATLSFGNTTVTKGATAGVGVQLGSNSGPITFTTLSSTTSSGSGLVGTNNSGAINVTTAAGSSIVAIGGAAIDITNAAGNPPVNLNFTTLTTTNSPVNAINLDRVGGTGLTVTGATTLDMAAGSGNVIDLTNLATTTIAISNASTVTVNDRRASGIFIDTAGGTVGFGTTTIPNPNGAGGYGIRVEDSSAAVTFASATISNTVQTAATSDAGSDGIPDSDGDGDAIFLSNNTGSFTLNGGTLTNLATDGIDIRNSRNLTVSGVTINEIGSSSANGATVDDAGIFAINLAGTNLVQNSTISNFDGSAGGGVERGIKLRNQGVNFTELRVNNTDFTNNAGLGIRGDDAILVETYGAVNGKVIVENGSTFSGLSGEAIQVNAGQSVGSGTMEVDIFNSTFQNPVNPGGFGGISIASAGNNGSGSVGTANLDVEVRGCTLTNLHPGNANAGSLFLTPFSRGTFKAVIDNNDMTGPGAAGRGAIRVSTGDLADEELQSFSLVINNNRINNFGDDGIFIDVRGESLTTSGNAGQIEITNNLIGTVTPVGQDGIEGITFRCRTSPIGVGSKTVNLLINANQVRNNDNSVGDETVDLDAEDACTVNATVTSNTFTSNGIAQDELRAATEGAGSVMCLDLRNNTATQGGGPAGNGSFTVEQAAGSLSLRHSGNNPPATTVGGVTITGTGCTLPMP